MSTPGRPKGEYRSAQHEGTSVSLRVVLHIDRLSLRGVPREQRDAVVQGLQEGLAQAFAQPGVAQQWAGSGHRERVRGSFSPSVSAEPASLGRDAARHIAGKGAP